MKLSLFFLLLSFSIFSADKKLFELKENCRQEIMNLSPKVIYKSEIGLEDRAENLVEDREKMIKSLKLMENKELLAKSLTERPWSDSYWPIYLGILGRRYNDPKSFASNFKDAHNYFLKNPVSNLISTKKFDYLSPSEKYDFLFNLKNENLTSLNWKEGEYYLQQSGEVETWMGMCHGWAPAAFMLPNPVKKVVVKVNQENLTFYPSDIKGLGTYLWAKGDFESKFIGGRCNTKNPPTDEHGRPKELDCLDNNPGTWHLVIVNQIGLFNKSFVMDATYDYQVWNQPVYAYEYSYFNPITGESFARLDSAVVKFSDFTLDQRKELRSDKTAFIVGIKMFVTYVLENTPSIEENQQTHFNTVEYTYDLELDSNYNIVGGEWYNNLHPDFLWTPMSNAFPLTYGDDLSISVDLNKFNSSTIKNVKINAKYGLPYGPVVRELFKKSAE